MENFNIKFNPSETDFNKLISLLDRYGFYDNIIQPHDHERIYKSYGKGNFIALYDGDEPIGLSVWQGEMQWAIIHYKWIHPDYRNRGIGRLFANLIYEEFRNRNIVYVLAQPATPCGEGMSKSFGFQLLADTDYKYDTQYRYLFLRQNRQQIQLSGSGYELLIWHDWNNQKEPSQIYHIDETMDSHPIISIVDSDAFVELRKDGVPIKRNVCKRLFTDMELQCYGLLYFNTNLSNLLERLAIQ